MLACAAALGAIVVGRFVVLPELSAGHDLIDANLAKAIAGPIHLRLSEVVLAASLVTAALAGRWLRAGWTTTVALVAVAASATQRFALLPAMYAAWSKADLVAGRPVEHIMEAQRLEMQELALVASIAALHLVLLFTASVHRGIAKPKASASTPAVAPPPATPATGPASPLAA